MIREDREMMKAKYANFPERKSPTEGQVGGLYNSLIFAEVLPPHPEFWSGKVIADFSANNLVVTSGLMQKIDMAAASVLPEGLRQPVQVYCNDLAYQDKVGSSTKLGAKVATRVQEVNQSLNNIQIAGVVCKDIKDLTRDDFGGNAPDVGLDRLGGLWYACEEGPEAVLAYLDHMYTLLAENGVLVVDDYGIQNKGDPSMSTGGRLASKFRPLSKLFGVMKEHGFVIGTYADDSGYGELGDYKDEGARIIVLRKIAKEQS